MRYRIALCGFSEFEHRAMQFSFQHPSGFNESEYDVVDALADADFAIVDADSKPAVKGILQSGRVAQTVFVGAAAPEGAASHLPRPIDTTRILRTLDDLTSRQTEPSAFYDAPLEREFPPVDIALDSQPPVLDDVVDVGDDARTISLLPEARPLGDDPRPAPTAPPLAGPLDPPPAPARRDWRDDPWPDSRPGADADLWTDPAPPPAAHPPAHPLERPAATPAAKSPPPAPLPPGVTRSDPDPEGPAVDAAARRALQSLAKANARAAARRARLASAQAAAGATAVLREVLVLDADPAANQLLCTLLQRFGFEPQPVAAIAQADLRLAAQPHAAVFLDIALDEGGVALLQRIRAMPHAPAVLMMTTHLEPADRVRAALAGVPAPLIKPLSRGDVARALESAGVPLPSDARRG